MEQVETYHRIKKKLIDRRWRINNLYKIKDKQGNKVTFVMNEAQNELYDNLHYFNCILKARQLGFTTFAMIYFLDACLFNANHSAGIVAHTLDDAKSLFRNKIKFAYDNLPAWLRELKPASSDSARTLEFKNKSSIYVGTSLRSGTLQKLLVSEFGKLSAKYPEKAREVKTGALNTIADGQQVFVESTAEGKTGEFYILCEQARKLADSNKPLARIEPKFFFFPWYKNSDYIANDQEVKHTVITSDDKKYFNEIEQSGVTLTPSQKAWYVLKKAQQGDDMTREYPTSPQEAFQGSLKGGFYTKEMRYLRENNHIRSVPYCPKNGVYTWWDLGTNDLMTILFYQYINGEHRFIDYHEASGEGWAYYAGFLNKKGYNYIKHFFPHDGNNRMRGKEIFTDKQMAEQCGIRPVKVTNRTKNTWKDIQNHCKPMLKTCYFDAEKCSKIILHLDNYRRKWSKSDGMFTNEVLHDDASHGADAYRTFAVNPDLIKIKKPPPPPDFHRRRGGGIL